MPVTPDRGSSASYARFPAELDRDWLGRACHLSAADLAVIQRRTDPVAQFGYATQLVTVRAIGAFQPDPAAVPEPVVDPVARQLGIDDPGVLTGYRDMPVRRRHTSEIRDRYGYRGRGADEVGPDPDRTLPVPDLAGPGRRCPDLRSGRSTASWLRQRRTGPSRRSGGPGTGHPRGNPAPLTAHGRAGCPGRAGAVWVRRRARSPASSAARPGTSRAGPRPGGQEELTMPAMSVMNTYRVRPRPDPAHPVRRFFAKASRRTPGPGISPAQGSGRSPAAGTADAPRPSPRRMTAPDGAGPASRPPAQTRPYQRLTDALAPRLGRDG